MAKTTDVMAVRVGGFFLADFGRDAFAELEVELTATADGGVVRLAIGEVAEAGRLVRAPGGYRCFKEAEIVLRPGTHTYRFPVPPHVAPNPALPKCPAPAEAEGEVAPFRYAELDGYQGAAVFRRHAYHADFDDTAAAFACDDPVLEEIWEFCRYSIKATSCFGKYIDGERERLPYEGDAYINQLGHFCCDAHYDLARATIDHFMIHPTWPTEWVLLTPVLARDYWLYSGDRPAVDGWLPRLRETLLLDRFGDDGLLRVREPMRDIVDWPPTERDGYEFGDTNLVPNCYALEALSAMFELTGEVFYAERAATLRRDIRRRMCRDGRFVDNPESGHLSLHGAVFALRFGAAGPEEAPALREHLRARGMAVSVYGAQWLLEACFRHGLADHAVGLMTADGLRSWRNMLAKGTTITMEAWDDSLKPNQDWNHAWGAAPANIIARELAGVRPTAPGFDRFVLDPRPGALTRFSLRQPTRHGPIDVEYDSGRLRLRVPKGATGHYAERELSAGKHELTLGHA